MSGDACKVKILQELVIQENGIIRNMNGQIIARLIEDIDFDSEHLIDKNSSKPNGG